MHDLILFGPAVSQKDLLELCAQEPIHTPGKTQPFAALLAGRLGNLLISHCSANLVAFLPIPASQALGRPLTEVLPDLPTNALDFSHGKQAHSLPLPNSSPPLHVSYHTQAGYWFVQLEPASMPGDRALNIDAQDLLRLSQHETLQSLFNHATHLFRTLLGYHRVMIYRFHEDWHGEVVAESSQDKKNRYLGLHFPEADIPRQARDLYHHERLRLIPDAHAAPIPLLASMEGSPLDLTGCVARAISPIHCEYLQNMGVRATLVISLIVQGRLWGLVACHHDSPRHMPPPKRAAALDLAQLLSIHITHISERETSVKEATFRQTVIQLALNLEGNRSPHAIFKKKAQQLLAPLPAAGITLLGPDPRQFYSHGRTPSSPALQALFEWLNDHPVPRFPVHALSTLPPEIRSIPSWPQDLAGLLAANVSSFPSPIWLIFFRLEWPREIHWGGDPHQTVSQRSDGTLSPRASFAAWTEIQQNHSRPWSPLEVDYVKQLALTLRHGLLIQDCQRAEIKYQLSEVQRTAILSALPDLLFVLDENNTYLDLHQPHGDLPYLPLSDLVGKTVDETHPPEVANRYRSARKALATESISIFEYTLDLPEHGTRHYEARLVHSSPGQVLCIVRDITAHRQAAEIIDRERQLFAAGPVALIVWHPTADMTPEYVSTNIQTLTGYPSTLFTEPTFTYTEHIHPDDITQVQAEIVRKINQRASHLEQTYRFRVADGTYRWIYDHKRLTYGENGEILSIRSYLLDQTQLKTAQDALRQRNKQIAIISAHVPGMLYEFRLRPDGSSCIPYASEGIRTLFGLSPESVVNDASPIFNLIHPEDLPQINCSIAQATSAAADWSSEFRIIHPERGLRWLHGSSSPRKLDDGSYVWNGYLFDITEQKKSQEKFLLESKREAIERLAGGIAHDFNNYLASLSLSIDLLLATPDLPPRAMEIASNLSVEVEAATSVARQLLAFTKEQPVHYAPVLLDQFLRECSAFALRGSPIRALVDVPNRALSVTTDPHLLRQVIFNLILNSRQAMHDKGMVFLSADSRGDKIVIRVEDNGPGLPEDLRSKIFEPYFTTKSSGSGLGLFVARSVMNRLGGELRLDPEAKEGAAFLLTLPIDTSSEPPSTTPTPPHSSVHPQAEPAPPPTEPDSAHRTHPSDAYEILLLEDNSTQVRLLTSFFESIKIPVHAFDDGANLLAKAQDYRDLGDSVICLLDITVSGGMGGLDIAVPLRKALPAAKIYFMSGYSAEWEEKQSAMADLNIGFIAKPYRLPDLRAKLFGPSTS
ncbi:MAG: hypothetical protein OHK005_02740 [Candidatus Methylacidiphilales bacterium]